MGLVKKLVCGCYDKCEGHTLHSAETVIKLNKHGKLTTLRYSVITVRSREIINKAIEEVKNGQ